MVQQGYKQPVTAGAGAGGVVSYRQFGAELAIKKGGVANSLPPFLIPLAYQLRHEAIDDEP